MFVIPASVLSIMQLKACALPYTSTIFFACLDFGTKGLKMGMNVKFFPKNGKEQRMKSKILLIKIIGFQKAELICIKKLLCKYKKPKFRIIEDKIER